MSFRQELRESPATYGLGAMWVLVYVLLNFAQGGFSLSEVSLLGFGAVRTDVSHYFGDLTWRDFSQGEPWRAVTATFIHFSVAHLLLNLIGLIQLGRMIEEWYGSKQFFAICIVLGGLGNVIGVCTRQGVSQSVTWMQSHGLTRVLPPFLKNAAGPGLAENIPSAGGSTIILGLIGLGLVVGWRSRTRVGLYLRDQMFGFLAFTAAIGIVCWNVIDNYGHAGGAIAGFLLGFTHRFLVRRPAKGLFRTFAFVGSLSLVAICATLQARNATRESAEVHRAQTAKERLLTIARDKRLLEQIDLLGSQFELVAYERLGPILAGETTFDQAAHIADVDLSPLYEISRYGDGRRPNLLATGPPPQAIAILRRILQNTQELHAAIDLAFMTEEFEALDRVGRELLTRLPSSRDNLAFRIARREISKGVSARLEALIHETEQESDNR